MTGGVTRPSERGDVQCETVMRIAVGNVGRTEPSYDWRYTTSPTNARDAEQQEEKEENDWKTASRYAQIAMLRATLTDVFLLASGDANP